MRETQKAEGRSGPRRAGDNAKLMTTAYQQRVFEALWPSSAPQWQKVCAVLDSARDPKIFGAVETCRLDKCCLYAGNIPWLLQKAAPYLVVLEPEDRFTTFLIE